VKAAFCWLYRSWLRHAVDSKDDWLVQAIDYLFGSSCKYCSLSRAVLFGLGVGLLFSFWIVGLALMGLAWALTLGEKYWLCE
jgi:hypothetical protein